MVRWSLLQIRHHGSLICGVRAFAFPVTDCTRAIHSSIDCAAPLDKFMVLPLPRARRKTEKMEGEWGEKTEATSNFVPYGPHIRNGRNVYRSNRSKVVIYTLDEHGRGNILFFPRMPPGVFSPQQENVLPSPLPNFSSRKSFSTKYATKLLRVLGLTTSTTVL